MSFGPNPWQQTNWDWRAAGNFMCGGAGASLVVFAVLARQSGASFRLPLLAGLVLVGMGLTCVWFEIGRPLRAINVYFNPRTSWMSREAFVAALLMPLGVATVFWQPPLGWAALLLALAFVFCQGRMLKAARGIPAWRAPGLAPLVMATGLAEGMALLWMLQPTRFSFSKRWLALAGVLLLLRAALWWHYRRGLGKPVAPRALAALDGAGRWLLLGGTLAPLVLLALGALLRGQPLSMPAMLLAGVAAAGSGAWFKYTLITRAGFNQGFALVHLPVRGTPR